MTAFFVFAGSRAVALSSSVIAPSKVFSRRFLDLIAPAAVKFNTDHYICGSMYHCTLALRSYPATTEELALLRHLGEKSGVTLSVYTRQVTAAEENGILHNAENKNRMARSSTNSMKQAVTAEGNLQDVAELIAAMRKNREPLIHCAVYIDLSARDPERLRRLREEVTAELVRSKLGTDQLLLRQQDGFLSSNPMGHNTFKSQYERVLPASSVANLYPFNYSGKTDPRGFYIGRDRYGSNIIVDLDRRAEDKTTASVLILGNSGQGKSYLLKLLLCNILETGKSAILQKHSPRRAERPPSPPPPPADADDGRQRQEGQAQQKNQTQLGAARELQELRRNRKGTGGDT